MLDLSIDKKFLELLNNYDSWIYRALDGLSITHIRMFLSAQDEESKLDSAFEMVMALTDLVEPNHHLFKNLCSTLYPDLHHFERAAGFTNPDYRSHLVHSCYVFLIGLYLIEKFGSSDNFFKKLNIGYFDYQFLVQNPQVYPYGTAYEMESFIKRWILTSICHDVAYQTENDYKSINTKSERITGYKNIYKLSVDNLDDLLMIPEASELREKFSVLTPSKRHSIADDALEIIAKRMSHRFDNYTAETIYNSLKNNILKSISLGFWDHGLMGGIYLIRSFMTNLNTILKKPQADDVLLIHNLYQGFLELTDAVVGIALHNFSNFSAGIFGQKKVKLQLTRLPLATMLILADEMQIWNRRIKPFPHLKKRITVNNQGEHSYNSLSLLHDTWKQMCYDLILKPDGIIWKEKKIFVMKVPFFSKPLADIDKDIRDSIETKIKFISAVEWLNEPPFNYDLSIDEIKREWARFLKDHGSLAIILDVCLSLFTFLEKWETAKNQIIGISKRNDLNTFKKETLYKLENLKDIGMEQFLPIENASFYDLEINKDGSSGLLQMSAETKILQKIATIVRNHIDNKELIENLGWTSFENQNDHNNENVHNAIQKLKADVFRKFENIVKKIDNSVQK
jgi:hypothetical protein